MSIRNNNRIHPDIQKLRDKSIVYGKHPWGPVATPEKFGRFTPKGQVHRYKTITLLGKQTKVPCAPDLELTSPIQAILGSSFVKGL